QAGQPGSKSLAHPHRRCRPEPRPSPRLPCQAHHSETCPRQTAYSLLTSWYSLLFSYIVCQHLSILRSSRDNHFSGSVKSPGYGDHPIFTFIYLGLAFSDFCRKNQAVDNLLWTDVKPPSCGKPFNPCVLPLSARPRSALS